MAKVKNGSSAEIEQNVSEVSEILTPEATPETPEVSNPLTDDEKLDMLKKALIDAKIERDELNEKLNGEETPEFLACEGKVNAARKAVNDFNKTLATKKNEAEFNEKLAMAKDDIANKLNLTMEDIDTLLTNSKDVKDTLKQSFNLVFGPVPVFAKQGATSKSLTTHSQTVSTPTNGEGNVNDIVGDLFNQGLTHEQILNMGHSEGRIRNVAYKLDYAKDKSTGIYSKRPR